MKVQSEQKTAPGNTLKEKLMLIAGVIKEASSSSMTSEAISQISQLFSLVPDLSTIPIKAIPNVIQYFSFALLLGLRTPYNSKSRGRRSVVPERKSAERLLYHNRRNFNALS